MNAWKAEKKYVSKTGVTVNNTQFMWHSLSWIDGAYSVGIFFINLKTCFHFVIMG